MFVEDELRSKKYRELLSIAKSLNIKKTKVKTEKLISAILSEQSSIESSASFLNTVSEIHNADNKKSVESLLNNKKDENRFSYKVTDSQTIHDSKDVELPNEMSSLIATQIPDTLPEEKSNKSSSAADKMKKKSSNLESQIPRFVRYAHKVNMPDFSKIHQRAFSRMETLNEYIEKKAQRSAKLTASSTKCNSESVKIFKPSILNTDHMKLSFTDADISFQSLRIKSLQKKEVKLLSACKSPKYRVNQRKVHSKKITSQPESRTPISFRQFKDESLISLNDTSMKESIIATADKRKSMNASLTGGSLKTKKLLKNEPPKNKLSYKPYTGPVKPLRDANSHKVLAERRPNIKNRKERIEECKTFIKGVRSNKRFDLLMAKRGIK